MREVQRRKPEETQPQNIQNPQGERPGSLAWFRQRNEESQPQKKPLRRDIRTAEKDSPSMNSDIGSERLSHEPIRQNRGTEPMYIMTDDGNRVINTSYLVDMELTGGSAPGESWEHPWQVVANLHYPDKIRRVTLFKDPRRSVALEMMKTYMTQISKERK